MINKQTYCTYCKNDISIKSKATTRPDLQMEKGEEFKVNCQSCGKIEKKHVNDITAEVNNKLLVRGVFAGILVSIILYFYLGFIGTVGILIPMILWQQQMSAKKTFNSYMIRRK